MVFDFSYLITIISFLILILNFIYSNKKVNDEKVVRDAKISSQLESLNNELIELKTDVKQLRIEIKADHEKVLLLENNVKEMLKKNGTNT